MAYDFSLFQKRAVEIIGWFKEEIALLRTGRASPALVENINVESYGAKTPLKHVAAISVEDARTLRIQPWDSALLEPIEKAIRSSELGLQPVVDKQSVRLILPELTQERRSALVKILGEKLENAKVSLRQLRDEIWRDIQDKERQKEISEDDKFRFKDDLQKKMDDFSKELEDLAEKKRKEISS
jgi:ribosome recycling factor